MNYYFSKYLSYEIYDIDWQIHDLKLRSKINLKVGTEKNLSNFIKLNIKEFLPNCVVESFSDILKASKNAGFPKIQNLFLHQMILKEIRYLSFIPQA